MEKVDVAIIGAGVTGLSFANWARELASSDLKIAVLERESEPGGYCRTIKQDGFVWDYSGHFFHFRYPEIENWLRGRMKDATILKVIKRSLIRFQDRDIDFPFQKNIHQLPQDVFVECLYDLYFRDQDGPEETFKEMLYKRLGKGISEHFLIPYNEKLYACDSGELDADAMGRFFPHASMDEIVGNMRQADNKSYNSTFIYPIDGAATFIDGLLSTLPSDVVRCNVEATAIDRSQRVVKTKAGDLQADLIVSTVPLPALCQLVGLPKRQEFSWNRVLVFNLGFDRKGRDDVHWMYFPDRGLPFYRVGWYDNIMGSGRMSLYVEIGLKRGQEVKADFLLADVLDGLRRENIVTDQQLVSQHSVLLDPAYVHITKESTSLAQSIRGDLKADKVLSLGRYGRWTYCSIEDNIVEARDAAKAYFG